ncbi:aldehyde dehydrogenase (NADP(+)) [Chromohalobacter beijerinckii]|uniref:Aldehyde dehydrogenase (NADP(+)) n=1 Tax=Chromohalobacter beijerinckii TaxID=86179 RepID=A0ABV8XEU0_9GAMM|nr:aldehyde dehydrogenase (NADP(+)) [Chromohalobacter beijerinckii]MCK0765729.1 aldehyde dehydrogenase (NADP(+)) [Chromohalobacter beijerinckii]
MILEGKQIIGQDIAAGPGTSFQAVDPANGETLPPEFPSADGKQVERACQLAWDAFDAYRETSLEERAKFLETIAEEIEHLGGGLIERAMSESGLPVARLEGERGRTCNQLRLFANVVRAGEWLDVRVDPALPERTPMPRPDLRQRHIPLGPVAVFGASNFPLAFSVAGGDTASALASGCPVIVKAHSAHPGTSELVARAIQSAAKKCNMPEGVFSMLFDAGYEVGTSLVKHPNIKAVGFTGSRKGGLALQQAAQSRPEPIPVYAEMSSINPVFLMPKALEARGTDLAQAFVGSLSMGAGQFCTNPGLVIGLKSPALDSFIEEAGKALKDTPANTMLTPGIHSAYEQSVAKLAGNAKVNEVSRGLTGEGENQCQAGLFTTQGADVLADESLQEEVFGATSLVVICSDMDEMKRVAEALEGQLTATLQMDEGDTDTVASLLPTLERKAGRIMANGWPTGVEVCHAMVHGGPFPATTDSRTTSVGSAAIYRFLRPVCYQNLSDALLPEALKEANSLGLKRLVDGKREG